MAAIVVIPARFGSTRFPGKIVASATGKPLVQHVVDQARQCRFISDVIVATDDERIVAALRPYETRCIMTSPNHPSGTDRVAEAAQKLGTKLPIINVQGDEPEIEPRVIDALAERIEESEYEMYTAAAMFRPPADPRDPNLVKVVFTNEDGPATSNAEGPVLNNAKGRGAGGSSPSRAMYFSRSIIPFQRDAAGTSPAYYLHVGIYAYQPDALIRLAGWKPTPCEQAEKLEQLRALEHGLRIGVAVIDRAAHGIDTPQQYEEFVKRYKGVASC